MKINATKTTYTVFSLSTKEHKAKLCTNGQTLLAEDNPTYLGVTFDRRLTWKKQAEKADTRGKVRLALMKKLAGSSWGADATTLKRLYTGRVRPVLEFGMTTWGTLAKTNIDRVNKVQNQATRIITGSMKSTPIQELETITGLQPHGDCRDTKLLTQAAKFKRLQDHPMKDRLSQRTKGRLKSRGSFVQAEHWNNSTRTSWIKTPKRFPGAELSMPGVGEHSLSFSAPSLELAPKIPKGALRGNDPWTSPRPISKEKLDPSLHRWFCRGCSSKWRGRNLHPVSRRQRRQNLLSYWPDPEALRLPSELAANSRLHCGNWVVRLTNAKKKKKELGSESLSSGVGCVCPECMSVTSRYSFSNDRRVAYWLLDVSVLALTEWGSEILSLWYRLRVPWVHFCNWPPFLFEWASGCLETAWYKLRACSVHRSDIVLYSLKLLD